MYCLSGCPQYVSQDKPWGGNTVYFQLSWDGNTYTSLSPYNEKYFIYVR
jgi:hypothetical protein